MNRSELTLEDIFDFGKHEGKQVEDIIHDDPGYIVWLISDGVCGFDEEAMELIGKRGVM